MRVYVAEKKDVARKIAAVVGAKTRKSGYFEGGGARVTWCVGHLVSLKAPNDYESEDWGRWAAGTLPMIPARWEYAANGATEGQYEVVAGLICDPDADEIVCATDGDREGEGIFRRVYALAGCDKPVLRLWTSSTEREAIEEALRNLKPSGQFDGLASSAEARAKADWLVGLNATRAYTLAYRSERTIRLGRVKTPTLAMVVRRDREIEAFEPVPYWQVKASLDGFDALTDRIDGESAARALMEACDGRRLLVASRDEERKRRHPPALYDLTALQRDAARICSLSPTETLEAAESLYLKELQTYPRTESRYLEQADADKAAACVGRLLAEGFPPLQGVGGASWSADALVRPSKVSGHPAILPTSKLDAAALAQLPEAERQVATLVMLRLVVAGMGDYAYTATTLRLVPAGADGPSFSARGQVPVELGWKGVQDATMRAMSPQGGPEGDAGEDAVLPDVAQGEELEVREYSVLAKKTKAPAAYTYDTLLGAMQSCGRELADEAQAQAVGSSGIGMPSTRDRIIEDLVSSGQIERKGKKLLSTDLGRAVVDVCDEELASVELTGEWEARLAEIEKGGCSPDEFLAQVEDYTRRIVAHAGDKRDRFAGLFAPRAPDPVGACPLCGRPVARAGKEGKVARCEACETRKTEEGYVDEGACPFKVYTSCLGRKLTDRQLAGLLAGKEVVLKGIKPKDAAKKPYSRVIRLSKQVDERGFARIELGDFVNDGQGARKGKGTARQGNWRRK